MMIVQILTGILGYPHPTEEWCGPTSLEIKEPLNTDTLNSPFRSQWATVYSSCCMWWI